MGLPKWRESLAKSLDAHCKEPESKFFQVANISIDESTNELSVENRTLVFRGFAENSILAITDNRTDKYKQWLKNPQSQICWYFTKTREQYRITSSVVLVGQNSNESKDVNSSIRVNVWAYLSEKAKGQFLWPSPKQTIGESPSQISVNENNIPETFTVLIFNPNAVDYLNLTTEPQSREIHSFCENTGKWAYKNVNA